MRILITGGGGFIGSNLTEACLKRGDEVRVIDNFATGRRENLAEVETWAQAGGGRFEMHEADIRDLDAVRKAVDGCDAVLHQAAIPSVARSVADPLTSHTVNMDGTLNLLVAARDAGVGRFVAASSSSLYGESPTLPKVETMPSAPLSPYGVDKMAGETYLRVFKQLYGLNTIGLRYFNVFGPRQDPGSEYSAVVPLFITRMARGERPIVHGDGEQTRDFTYIQNVIQMNLLCAEAPEEACGEAYNVACGERISLLELIRRLNTILGTEHEPEHGPPRAGDIKHSLADIDKARRNLGYEVEVDIDEGLRRTVAWLIQ